MCKHNRLRILILLSAGLSSLIESQIFAAALRPTPPRSEAESTSEPLNSVESINPSKPKSGWSIGFSMSYLPTMFGIDQQLLQWSNKSTNGTGSRAGLRGIEIGTFLQRDIGEHYYFRLSAIYKTSSQNSYRVSQDSFTSSGGTGIIVPINNPIVFNYSISGDIFEFPIYFGLQFWRQSWVSFQVAVGPSFIYGQLAQTLSGAKSFFTSGAVIAEYGMVYNQDRQLAVGLAALLGFNIHLTDSLAINFNLKALGVTHVFNKSLSLSAYNPNIIYATSVLTAAPSNLTTPSAATESGSRIGLNFEYMWWDIGFQYAF